MLRSALEYDLPADRIAQAPVEPRDQSRLLVLHRESGRLEHRRFAELAEYLAPGDCLVLNDTRVVPARFFGRRSSGGRVEGLFLHETDAGWRVLLKPARRLRAGERLILLPRDDAAEPVPVELELLSRLARGEWLAWPDPTIAPLALLADIGHTPLPPYIHSAEGPAADRYQTVYAERPGAIAAPTAGLHFTPELLARLQAKGVTRAAVTLHVGAGTFQPIEAAELAQHRMHSEWYELSTAAAEAVNAARRAERAIVAVGTTAARVLETAGRSAGPAGRAGEVVSGSGWTDLFIYPPYRWRVVDRLVTNFHLPGSTLLALVMALAGEAETRAAYATAIREGYRFYSFGDAMLII